MSDTNHDQSTEWAASTGPMPWRQPIVVTGGIRSGTTWMGKMLTRALGTAYIDEPFNPTHPLNRLARPHPITRFNFYVTPATELDVLRYLRFRMGWPHPGLLSPSALAQHWRAPHRLGGMALYWCAQHARAWAGARPVLKDPIALVSSEWLEARLRARMIILIRHPAAFVSSMMRLGWRGRLGSLVRQPELAERFLGGLVEEVETSLDRPEPDPVADAVLHWRVMSHVTHQLRQAHPGWMIVRHEDASREPMAVFKAIHAYAGLPWTPKVAAHIQRYTSPENPTDADGKVHQLYRNSRENIWIWKKRLTQAQIAQIRKATEDIAGAFYGPEDW